MQQPPISAKVIFDQAVEIPSPPEQEAYLDQACAGSPELRQKVVALLAAYRNAGSFLQTGPAGLMDAMDQPVLERAGTQIGPYKLMEQIGEGGMGLVFVAEQHQPIRRKVALKVIKPGMDSREVIARFEAERQALALMDHPNIAKVLDAGTTGSGRPYFVMELVKGVPITQFCDENRLAMRARMELFTDVCHAVQHAHQKGIIHRDIKPTNVMVASHDGTPVVKVIDFGVAKAIGQQLTERTIYTALSQMVGTPLYTSPEQAGLSGLDVDTRTDIYSLGVLLYELLTGTTPFDKERLKRAAFDEMRRIIREEEPQKPSTRISQLQNAERGVRNAQSTPRSDPRIPNLQELDWIVMKALEKDRNRRYDTADGLAQDVQRYLADEPVQACPPSVGYRLRKFVRRHNGPVLATLLVLLALVVGIVVATWGMLRAADAEAVAVNEAKQKGDALTAKESALADAQNQLFQALVSQARAERGSGRIGQRFKALKAIRAAARIRITPELRTEATAAVVLPDVELAQEWEGRPDHALNVTFDAGFQRYARLDKEGCVVICRLSHGREEVITRLPPHDKTPFYIALLSRDARFVACGYGASSNHVAGGVKVWKLDGSEPEVLLDEAPGIHGEVPLAFHSSGRQLAVGHADNSVSVYDLTTGQRVQRLALSAAPLHLAFHPRDDRLAVACGNVVKLFDTNSGEKLSALLHPTTLTPAYCLTWHHDGRRLAVACSDRKIHLWDTQTATEVMTPWMGHTADGLVVAFNHAGDRLVSNDWDGRTRLWDTVTGRMLLTMPGDFGLQFSSDDRLLGPEYSGNKMRLWRVAGGHELRVLRPRSATGLDNIASPVIHADGRTLAVDTRHHLCFFDLASGEELASVQLLHLDTARPAYFDPPDPSQVSPARTGGWMTGGHSGLYLWPATHDSTRPEVMRIGPPQQIVENPGGGFSVGASASADGRIMAVPQGNSTLILYRDHPDRRTVLGPQHDVRFCAVSPDGHRVVTCSFGWDGHSKGIRIWNADTGEQVHELATERYSSATFSPDGRWLATMDSTGSRQWEVGVWREVRRYDRGKFAFSTDSKLLAINDEFSVIRLLETTTGREVARLTGPEPTWYSPACFTPDGTKLVATCSGETALYVWDLRLIRQQLKDLGLDWDWPDFKPAAPDNDPANPRELEILLGELGKPP